MNSHENHDDLTPSNSESDPENQGKQVGYCSPPKHSQFKPGQSGNPKGRPRSPRNLAEAVDKRLKEKVTISEHGQQREVHAYEAIAMKLVNDALSSTTQKSNAALQKINQLGVAGQLVESFEIKSKEASTLDPALLDVLGIDLARPPGETGDGAEANKSSALDPGPGT